MIPLDTNLALTMARTWPLWGGISFIVILILYLIHRRWQTVEVSSHLLWTMIITEEEKSSAWRWLQNLLSLLLWLFIVAAAVMAATGPAFEERYQPEDVIFVLDNSLSMSVTGEGEAASSRLQHARSRISDYIKAAHDEARFQLFTSAPSPRLLQGWTTDKQVFLQTLASVDTAFAPGDLAATLTLAKLAQGDTETTALTVFSDGSENAELQDLYDNATFVVINHGESNIGVQDFHLSQDPYYLNTSGALRIHNYAGGKMQCNLRVNVGETELLNDRIDIEAGKEIEVTFPVPWEESGLVTVDLLALDGESPADTFHWDNHASAYIAGRRMPRMILVEPEAGASLLWPVLVSLKEFLNLQDPVRLTPTSFQDIHDQIEDKDIIFFDGCSPLQALPPAQYVMFHAEGEHIPFALGEWFEPETMRAQHQEHPLVRFVSLQRVLAKRVQRIAMQDDMTVYLLAGNSPVIFSGSKNKVRMLYLAFHLSESNLILLDSFPMFLANLLRENSRQYKSMFQSMYWTGDLVEPRTQFNKTVKVLRYENGTLADTIQIRPNDEHRIWITDTTRPGQYYLQEGDTTYSPACVNFRMPQESNIAATQKGADITLPNPPEIPWLVNRPLQRWLLWLAVGLLAIEWLVFTTKRN